MIRTSSQFLSSRLSKLARKKLRSATKASIKFKWRWRSQRVNENLMWTRLTMTLDCPLKRRRGKLKGVLARGHNACLPISQVRHWESWNTAVLMRIHWKVRSVKAQRCQETTSESPMVSTLFSSLTRITSMLTCQVRFTLRRKKPKRGTSLSMRIQRERRGNCTLTPALCRLLKRRRFAK